MIREGEEEREGSKERASRKTRAETVEERGEK